MDGGESTIIFNNFFLNKKKAEMSRDQISTKHPGPFCLPTNLVPPPEVESGFID